MKKVAFLLIMAISVFSTLIFSQDSINYTKIDLLLVQGNYNKAIDTCRQILAGDSLNSEIYFRMGLAYQNFLPDDKSFDCFLKAASISPENNNYNFMVAKGYFGKGKMNQARELFQRLCQADTLNWSYAYYLTSIYMQAGKYDESIEIYNRFCTPDSSDYIILDKVGFAYLRKKDFETATYLYNRSLAINDHNVNALKNLSYLYASTQRIDTAIQLLTRAIEIDPTDMDLYARRGAIHFSINYNKRALNDYLKILGTGDSSILYLKRAGIGYTYNLQPKEANVYLLEAYKKDSSDIETTNFLARNYETLKDLKKSAYYYRQIIKTVSPFSYQMSLTYMFLGEVLKSDGQYKEAIAAYLKSQETRQDPSITMIVANLYDEKLNDTKQALFYYKHFLNNYKSSKMPYQADYIESVKKRVELLKTRSATAK